MTQALATVNKTVTGTVEQVYSREDLQLIRETVAKGATPVEFDLFLYTAKRYNLDPLVKQIWCVKYGSAPAAIFTSRDGFLAIAHRSGQFDGMKTVAVRDEKGTLVGAACTVWRKDMSHPFEVEVPLSEYASGSNPNWKSRPETMIKKVAESQALRRAFDIAGLYAPEELDMAEIEKQKDRAQPAQLPVTKQAAPTALVPESDNESESERQYPPLKSDEFKKWVEREFNLTMAQLAGKLSGGKVQTIKEVLAAGSRHAVLQREMFPGDPMRYVLWAYVDHIARNEPQNVAFLWDKDAGLPIGIEDLPFGFEEANTAQAVDAEVQELGV